MAQNSNLTNKGLGPQSIDQGTFQKDAFARKVIDGLLVPGSIITADISAAGVYVGKGNILRVRVTAQTYVAFGQSGIGAVTSATSPGIELNSAGVYLVVATDDYVRASLNSARLEVLNG